MRIGRQHNAPLAVVAADLIGAVALFYRRHRRQRHPPRGRLDHDLRKALHRSRGFRQPHYQGKTPAAVNNLRNLFALDQARQHRQYLRRRNTVLRRLGVINAHLDLRRKHLLLDFQVRQPRDAGELAAQHLRLPAQGIQVFAEKFDGDLRTHARKHMVDAV